MCKVWRKFCSNSRGKGKGKCELFYCFIDFRMYVEKIYKGEWYFGKFNGIERDKYWYLIVSFYNNNNNGIVWI